MHKKQRRNGENMRENFGETICQYRQNLKMTQEDFAYRLGVTPQAVSRWERGNGLPDLSLLKGICNILHVSADTLLGIRDNSVTENNNVQMEREIRYNLFAEPVVVEFGEALIPCVLEGMKTDYLNRKRNQLAQKYGVLLPVIRFRDNLDLGKNAYRILSYDHVLYEACSKLCESESDTAAPFHEIIDSAAEECRKNYSRILNKQIVKIMVDSLKEHYPGIADGLVPEKISYLRLTDHLKNMLNQGKPIRDLIHILEEMERGL